MFWEHRYGAVDEVDRCGPLLRLLVYDRPFEHVVAHVGYVHTYFPHTVLHLLDGYGVVKVLGVARVDCDGKGVAEVLSLGYLLFSDARIYLVGCRFHILRILVWQSVLSEYGMHLGVVVSSLSEDIYHLTYGVTLLHGPVYNPHHHLVTVLSTT